MPRRPARQLVAFEKKNVGPQFRQVVGDAATYHTTTQNDDAGGRRLFLAFELSRIGGTLFQIITRSDGDDYL